MRFFPHWPWRRRYLHTKFYLCQPEMTDDGTAAVQLYDKELAEIPEEVLMKCDSIGILDLSRNPGICLHGRLGRFKNVKKLVLHRCELHSIPDEISVMTEIEELDISGNDMSDGLNPALGRLHRLKKLHLWSCDLRVFPDWIGNLEELQELELSHNQFSAPLSNAIGRLRKLKMLGLWRCNLLAVPESLGDLQLLEMLFLSSNNFSSGLSSTVGRLRGLKRLSLRGCGLPALPDWLGNLQKLEVLEMSNNHFPEGLCLAMRRLRLLKNLDLSGCLLTSIPDFLGDLVELEDLNLSHNVLSGGLRPSVGRLHRLKKLNLSWCYLHDLPEALGDLQELEELDLSNNELSDGLHPCIGRLHRLKKLIARWCQLRSIPDSLGGLKALEELDLSGNQFFEGLNPAIGGLSQLKILWLCRCQLRNVPDSLGGLQAITSLYLTSNDMQVYPNCTLRMTNLVKLDVSNFPRAMPLYLQPPSCSNCIMQLPVELAFTGIRELTLHGNPITDPPVAIWTQGVGAIKSYMRALIPGGELLLADTVNIIGDTGAGKTSIAESLVAQSPRLTAQADRTVVMQQLRMRVNETSGHAVYINDFGGHEIYHSIMPVFLPENGLIIIVFNMTSQIHEERVKKWLLTALAKCREIRIIVAGTHADQVLSVQERLVLEERMTSFSSNVLKCAVGEVRAHINHVKSKPDVTHAEDKLNKLSQVLSNLQGATLRVVTLSCSVHDDGLLRLRNLAAELLRQPETLPARWCRFINEILQLSVNALYITMDHARETFKSHCTSQDDQQALTTVLRYLAKTSQIIWVEENPRLQNLIFHSPTKIIDACKDILHHEASNLPAHYEKERRDYEQGILREPLLRELLEIHTVKLHRSQEQDPMLQPFDVIVDFLQQFNIIGSINTNNDGRKFIIPCKLSPNEPTELKKCQEIEESCLNRVTVCLSFIGSVVPMSFFETCLTAMLKVTRLFVHPAIRPWRSGLLVIHGGVYFVAKLGDGSVTLTAYSEPPFASPWIVLQPMLCNLNETVACWYGAPPTCFIRCSWCARHCEDDRPKSDAGEIEIALPLLAGIGRQLEMGPTCNKCLKLIPRSLCFPTVLSGSYAGCMKEIQEFFKSKDERSAPAAGCNLERKLDKVRPQLVKGLDSTSVECIIDELIAARNGNGLITEEERQLIKAEKTDKGKARCLLDAVARHGDEAVRILAATLSSSDCARPDLAELLQE